jgi:hypothetical protein
MPDEDESVCELCEGTGEVEMGEYDNIYTKPCPICKEEVDMDDDS